VSVNSGEILSRARGNFDEQNMALEHSIILRSCIIIIIIIIIIINAYLFKTNKLHKVSN